MNQAPGSILSFIYAGVLIVLTVAGIVLFSWLLLIGAMVGLGLYLLFWIRLRFFSSPPEDLTRKPSGRIIEHDDNDSLR